MDFKVTDGSEEKVKVMFLEYSDGSLGLEIDNEPAICSMEMMANWAYTMSNWKRRIDKDAVAPQPQPE